ncbi:MAG: hypothetical protein M1335_00835 [Chloroflexi bacterium]|nr:hypothetical protein [Chloroflexota bacterium]
MSKQKLVAAAVAGLLALLSGVAVAANTVSQAFTSGSPAQGPSAVTAGAVSLDATGTVTPETTVAPTPPPLEPVSPAVGKDGGVGAGDGAKAVEPNDSEQAEVVRPENHGEHVSEAAHAETPDGYENHGATVREAAHSDAGKPSESVEKKGAGDGKGGD